MKENVFRATLAEGFLQSVIPQNYRLALNKEGFAEMGRSWWPYSFKGTESFPLAEQDQAAEANINRYLDDLPYESAVVARQLFQIPDKMIGLVGSARWFDQGMPSIRVGHKLASAIMASSVSKDTLDLIRPPWRAFIIDLPSQLVTIDNPEGGTLDLAGVLVWVSMKPDGEERWSYLAYTHGPSTLALWVVNSRVDQLVDDDVENSWEGFALDRTDRDERATILLGRYITGVCLTLSNPDHTLTEQRRSKPKRRIGKVGDGPPQYRIFQLTKPIQIDCQRAVRDYNEGIGNSPNVRVLVRGHFKGQPYGPKNSLRKVIWREPHWRGLDGQAIAQRDHVIPDALDRTP